MPKAEPQLSSELIAEVLAETDDQQSSHQSLPHELIHNYKQDTIFTDGEKFTTTSKELAETLLPGKPVIEINSTEHLYE